MLIGIYLFKGSDMYVIISLCSVSCIRQLSTIILGLDTEIICCKVVSSMVKALNFQ